MRTTDEEIKDFVQNIIWIRKYHRLSKKQMASLSGISVYSLNKLEKGVLPKRLGVNVLFNIEKNFNIFPRQLFNEKFEEK